MTRQVEQDASVSDSSPHIANIGKMVEDMENKIRYVMYKILMYMLKHLYFVWYLLIEFELTFHRNSGALLSYFIMIQSSLTKK